MKKTVFILLSFFSFFTLLQSKKVKEPDEENCEVCVKFLRKFENSLDSSIKNDPVKIEKEFMSFCENSKKSDNRFCYYVGGLETSASRIIGELSKPLSWGMPVEKVCGKLNKQDQQICELKYDKSYDFATINLKKLKVKDLRNILAGWDETCKGCTEKQEFISLVEELLPKYAPEAAASRKKSEL